jgi:hypothetical protein
MMICAVMLLAGWKWNGFADNPPAVKVGQAAEVKGCACGCGVEGCGCEACPRKRAAGARGKPGEVKAAPGDDWVWKINLRNPAVELYGHYVGSGSDARFEWTRWRYREGAAPPPAPASGCHGGMCFGRP